MMEGNIKMKIKILIGLAALLIISCTRKFDILIVNGTIIDGTGKPGYVGNLAINGDKIVAIGEVHGNAKTEIDASGLVISPGFIDIHTHSDFNILTDGKAESAIRQGVTTDVIGESSSAGPYTGQLHPKIVRTDYGTDTIVLLRDYFRIVEKNGSSINVASYVGTGNVWECVMGYKFDPPSDDQLNEMKKIVKQAMEDGAYGLSSILAQPPGSLIPTNTMVELCKVVSQYNGVYATHIRSEGIQVFDAVREAIEIGAKANVPVDILHIKIADQRAWGRMNEIIAIIDSARSKGVKVRANVYPFTRGNNSLGTIIPEWAHEGGFEKLLERLRNNDDRTRMKKEIENGIEGWYNHYIAVGKDWSRMLLCSGKYAGLTMDSVITLRSKNKKTDPLDILFDLLLEEKNSISTVYAHHTEEDMNLALKQPWCSIGSDGSALAIEGPLSTGHPHPRNFGTFPRVLGYYARTRHLITMEEAVYKMTGLNADKLGIKDRGTLAIGNFADITLFNPATVIDKATYENPFQYNVGIEYVLVNGIVVLKGETHTGKRPGRALKRS
jgi:N-acyl-D-amino-acid deacylase